MSASNRPPCSTIETTPFNHTQNEQKHSKQQKWLTTKLRRLWLTTAPACPCRMCKWRASATSLTPKGADHLSPLAVASSVKRRGVSALRDRETTNVLRRCL